MMKRFKLISIAEAVQAKRQHEQPCSDCPWARDALHGWLGGASVEEWLQAAHGDERIDCHVLQGAQCAGAAIFRRNTCKTSRDPEVLVLPRDIVTVFASDAEFADHHTIRPLVKRNVAKKRA